MCGFYYNEMIFISTECDIKHTLHHELYHAIDAELELDDEDDEWDEINIYDYTLNYDKTPLKTGFVTNYGMKNQNEDKATIYEEMITLQLNISYDDIVKSKIRLMFQRLIGFDSGYLEIFMKVCEKNEKVRMIFKNDTKQTIPTNNNYYVLEDVEYSDDEDDFVLNFDKTLANQKETERFINLVNTKYILLTHYGSHMWSHVYIIKKDKLVMTINNNIAHIFGWIGCNKELQCSTNIPSSINTNSKITRILSNSVILDNNKLIYLIGTYTSQQTSERLPEYKQKMVNIYNKMEETRQKFKNLQSIENYLKESQRYAYLDISFYL
jgi:hypothetical protein